MPSGFRLVVIAGPNSGLQLEVGDSASLPLKIGRTDDRPGQDEQIIGRLAAPDRDLLLDGDPLVSRGHARIEVVSGGYVIVDCGSANGTKRSGEALRARLPVRLRNGDELRFGTESVVRFEVSDGRPVVAPVDLQRVQEATSQDTPHRVVRHDLVEKSADTPSVRQSMEPPPQDQFGRFAVYDCLSISPASTVHVALDTQLGQKVALRRYGAGQLPASARRVVEECASRTRGFDHRSVVPVLDSGEHDGVLFVATKLVDGRSLFELQRDHVSDISIPLALHLMRSVCAALRYAQSIERGWTWRYLTPRGVVVDRTGTAVVVSFGLPPAVVLLEGENALLATPESRYLSPELRGGKKGDPRSDIYSAGVILHELLVQQFADHTKKVLPEIDMVRNARQVPMDVADLTSRAVRFQVGQRYLHPAEMEEALEAVLEKIAPNYGPEAALWMERICSETGAPPVHRAP